ncbi:MAG: anthranilate synthase component I family protein [Candidatus Marsarchaeota archaeon]|nr:anthranilate synthase component I family protein [Candidatus Marsarchaeota archaeon]
MRADCGRNVVASKVMPVGLKLSPAGLFSAILEHCDTAFLLESTEGQEKLARYSFLGFSPARRIALKDGVLDVDGDQLDAGDPIKMLKHEISRSNAKSEGFTGGAVGYFSFDYFRYIERLREIKDEVHFPDFEFGIFDDAVVFDHKSGSINYIYHRENRLGDILAFVKDAGPSGAPFRASGMKCNVSREKYCRNVEAVKEYIRAGEVFQTVLSKRYETDFSGSMLPFYNRLKTINPSPYMYYLKFRERQIVGSSPENLIRINGRKITSYATIAGTRPRGKTLKEDRKLEKDLLGDEKERAEHIMLVDLTRNDVGKVAEIGTVKVPELMRIVKFSHVQHISSLVTARLDRGKDAFDAFNAIFPAGTVSGAPKIRAIEIIDRLENSRRGPYAGAVGYFSSNGNSDFAIGLRTLFANKGKAYIQSGGGIVYDSVPENEFQETEHKARGLLEAISVVSNENTVNR